MSIGEVISAFTLCASDWDDDRDRLLMLKGVYSIEVGNDYVDVYFVDANTSNIRISKDGRAVSLSEVNT